MLMNLVKSETVKDMKSSFLENAIGAFMKDPVSIMNLLKDLGTLPVRIRDAIYWNNFETYIFRVYDYDKGADTLIDNNKKNLSEMLAEDTPNHDSNYSGNPEKLRENAKRLIKLLDDAGTKQKSIYYANLTRAVLNDLISRDKFFKLCKCISELTEEDICLFIKNIQITKTATINVDLDYIDDFRAVGLLKEVSGGFAYTNRAFELWKYGLCYEDDVKIPERIQERFMIGPGRLGSINDMINSDEEVLTVKVH